MKPNPQTLFDKITKNDLSFAKTLTNDSLTTRIGSDYPIHIAIKNGHRAMVKIFLKINPTLVNQLNIDGQSPLILAVKNQNQEICGDLLLKKAKINQATDYVGSIFHGYTPLHWARRNKNRVMITTLINAGAIDTPINGDFLIHEAAKEGWVDIAELRIDEDPALINQKNLHGETPLILAIQSKKKEMCDYLLSKKADVNQTANYLHSPSHKYTALQWMRENANWTSTHDDLAMMTNLIQAEAKDTPLRGDDLIHQAVRKNWLDIANYLIKKKPSLVNKVNQHGETPLIIAIKCCKKPVTDTSFSIWFNAPNPPSPHLALVQHLVANGANLNAVSDALKEQTAPDVAALLNEAIACKTEQQNIKKRKREIETNTSNKFSNSTMTLFSKQDNKKTIQENRSPAIGFMKLIMGFDG